MPPTVRTASEPRLARDSGHRVVVISTAHGLKFGDIKANYHAGTQPGIAPTYANPVVPLAANRQAVYDAVMRHMEKTIG